MLTAAGKRCGPQLLPGKANVPKTRTRESQPGFHLEITTVVARAHTDPPQLPAGSAVKQETLCVTAGGMSM